MKKIFLFIFTIVLIIAGIVFLFKNYQYKDRYREFKKIDYRLENKNLKLLVADIPEKWERGLMYFRKLEGVDGMIFIFPDKQPRTFWNKNTYLDLDLYWLNESEIVGKSYLPSIKKSKEIVTVSSPKEVNKVIELPNY